VPGAAFTKRTCGAIIACSRHVYIGVVLRAHLVRGESHIQPNANPEVSTEPSDKAAACRTPSLYVPTLSFYERNSAYMGRMYQSHAQKVSGVTTSIRFVISRPATSPRPGD